MTKPGRTAVILALLLCTGAAAPRDYGISVNVAMPQGAVKYSTVARVVSFGADYRAAIAYAGSQTTPKGRTRTAAQREVAAGARSGGIPAVVATNPGALILNGGFYTDDPSRPAGLLMVGGRVISPFNFATYRDGDSRLNVTLCVKGGGKLSFLNTAALKSRATEIGTLCTSAMQSHPRLLAGGRNQILASELRRPRYVRSTIGLRADGSAVAVFFTQPVHLFVAAEFMRAAPRAGAASAVTRVGNGPLRVTNGLGLVEAANLDGDSSSVGVLGGRVLTGDLYRELPSVVILQ